MNLKGPWKYTLTKGEWSARVLDANDDLVATVPVGGSQEALDRARLIALLPELLAACELAYQFTSTFGSDWSDVVNEALKAVLAKVRGQ